MAPALEVADIFRRHGEAFRQARAGHLGRRRATRHGRHHGVPDGGARRPCRAVRRLRRNAHRLQLVPQPSLSRSAKDWPGQNGSRIGKPSCCRCRTSTSSSHCRHRSARSRSRTRPSSTRSCSARRPRHSPPSPPIPGISAPKLGMTMVLHTWGQTLQHHPHVHCVVPGGGPSLDGTRWVACRPGFFLPVRVLSRLFRRLFLQELENAFGAGKLRFFSNLANLAEPQAFARRLARTPAPRLGGLRQATVRRPRTGAGLSRPLHPSRRHRQQPAALARRRQGPLHLEGLPADGKTKVMTLDADEFIRRFLLHALPDGFHRIRHYGFLANGAPRRQPRSLSSAARCPCHECRPRACRQSHQRRSPAHRC